MGRSHSEDNKLNQKQRTTEEQSCAAEYDLEDLDTIASHQFPISNIA